MSLGTALVVIAAIIAWAVIRVARIRAGDTGRIKHRRSRHDSIEATGPSPRELELQSEVEQLRDRVKVLERIATDEHKPQRLAAEIESLRDN